MLHPQDDLQIFNVDFLAILNNKKLKWMVDGAPSTLWLKLDGSHLKLVLYPNTLSYVPMIYLFLSVKSPIFQTQDPQRYNPSHA